MLFSRSQLFLACLIVLLGIGLSYSAVLGIGLMKILATPSWFLEGRKAGQVSIVGRYSHSEFGRTLAIGDVNGDGFDDLIANAPYVSEIVQGGGEVYVMPGPLAFNQIYTLPQSAALVFQGAYGYQPQVGNYLDSGDMNGDGFDDIVLGSWVADQAYVYLGSENIYMSSPLTVVVSPSNMALTISPTSDGLALCDFNSDGYQDLFVEEFAFEQGIQVWGVLGNAALTMTQPQTLRASNKMN